MDAARDAVEALGFRARRAHRPHLTLGAARVEAVEDVVAVAQDVAARHAAFPLVLDGVCSFAAGVLWLGTEVTASLAALQRDVDASLRSAGHPRAFGTTDPSGWVPHCTLATRIPRDRLPAARRSVRVGPIIGRVDALAVVLVGGRGDVALAPLRPAPAPAG